MSWEAVSKCSPNWGASGKCSGAWGLASLCTRDWTDPKPPDVIVGWWTSFLEEYVTGERLLIELSGRTISQHVLYDYNERVSIDFDLCVESENIYYVSDKKLCIWR